MDTRKNLTTEEVEIIRSHTELCGELSIQLHDAMYRLEQSVLLESSIDLEELKYVEELYLRMGKVLKNISEQ